MARDAGGQSPTSIAHHLKGIDFPASRSDLETHARGNGADEDVLEAIRAMQADEFATMADVMKAYGRER